MGDSSPPTARTIERLVGTVFGRSFAVAGPKDFLTAVRPDLPTGWERTDAPADRTWTAERVGDGLRVRLGDDEAPVDGSARSLARLVAQDVELWAAERAERRIVVHAGVVAVGGRAVLLPGPSRSGKSTLVSALVDAGATYYSDEFAVLDPGGLVLPYRRTPRYREDSPAAGHTLDVAGPEPDPAPVALVAQLAWHEKPGSPWRPLTRAEAGMALLANTIAARSRAQEALAVFDAVTLSAILLGGDRGEARAAAAALVDRLAR